MTINLTELRDEPLGKHPIRQHALTVLLRYDVEQDVVAADHESSFTFDVDGLSDEALDPRPAVITVRLCRCIRVACDVNAGAPRLVAAMRNPI